MVPDVVGDHGGWGLRPVGCQPGGICQVGAQHRLQPQAQAQDPRSPRSRDPLIPGTPSPRPCLHHGPGSNLSHPRHARHGMLHVF